jgi:hypothetical protein
VRLATPWAASRVGGAVHVAGLERGSPDGALAAATLGLDGAVSAAVSFRRETDGDEDGRADGGAEGGGGWPDGGAGHGGQPRGKPSSIDLLASPEGLLVLVDAAQGGPWGLRAPAAGALRGARWERAEAALCSSGNAVYSLARRGAEQVVSERSFAGGEASVVGQASAQTQASLACGASSAFLLGDEGTRRVATALGVAHGVAAGAAGAAEGAAAGAAAGGARPVVLTGEPGDGDDDERAVQVVPDGDGLLVLRLGERGSLSLRAWDGRAARAGAWVRASARAQAGASIDLVLPGEGRVAAVLTRPAPPGKPCRNGEEADTVAELWVIDRASGRVEREGERLERWTCGAEAGPFWGGLVKGSFVVTWPRGADAACARLGVRFGGVAYVAAAASGPLRTGRVDAPADDVLEAGCGGDACVLVALSRGEPGACAPAAGPASGAPRVLVLP